MQILEKRIIGCSGYDKLSGLYGSLLPRDNKQGVKMQLVCIRHPDIFRLESLGCSVPRSGVEIILHFGHFNWEFSIHGEFGSITGVLKIRDKRFQA